MKRISTMTMVVMVVTVVGFLAGGCAIAPVSRGNFQSLDERVEMLEIAVGNNIDRLDKVETQVEAVTKLRAKINGYAKRTGQLEDRISYASPKVYAFWARGFDEGSSILPEEMKAQLDVLTEAVKKENITIRKIVGYAEQVAQYYKLEDFYRTYIKQSKCHRAPGAILVLSEIIY